MRPDVSGDAPRRARNDGLRPDVAVRSVRRRRIDRNRAGGKWRTPLGAVVFSVPTTDRARARLESVLDRIAPDVPRQDRSEGRAVSVCSVELAELLERNGFDGSALTKRVPAGFVSFLRNSALFVAGYLDADGCAPRGRRGFSLKSVNRALLADVAEILTTMGITSRLHTEHDGERVVEILGYQSLSRGAHRLEFAADHELRSMCRPRLHEAVANQSRRNLRTSVESADRRSNCPDGRGSKRRGQRAHRRGADVGHRGRGDRELRVAGLHRPQLEAHDEVPERVPDGAEGHRGGVVGRLRRRRAAPGRRGEDDPRRAGDVLEDRVEVDLQGRRHHDLPRPRTRRRRGDRRQVARAVRRPDPRRRVREPHPAVHGGRSSATPRSATRRLCPRSPTSSSST